MSVVLNKKVALILLTELVEAVVIVACTRVYVEGHYGKTAALEVAYCANWFWSRNIGFDVEARDWKTAFPAYALGAVLGAWLGLWLTR